MLVVDTDLVQQTLLMINYLEKTGKENIIINGHCSKCSSKTSMTVSGKKITAERVGDFLKYQGKKAPNSSKKMVKFVPKKMKDFDNWSKHWYGTCI